MPVNCAVCEKRLRRRQERTGNEDHPNAYLPDIWTRTLVMGTFLPSCSRECAVFLRRQAGVETQESYTEEWQ
jgi:hypothetical protein